MASPQMSTHIPGRSGGIEKVTGSLIVDTGILNVRNFTVTLGQATAAGAAVVAGALTQGVAGKPAKLELLVFEDDTTTPSTDEVLVSWSAEAV